MTESQSEEKAKLEARVRKLNREASETAMELHDLTEELPTAYLRIMEVAKKSFEKHEELARHKAMLNAMNDSGS